jgi:RNA polymerase sigma factor (sigma-70 family)
MPPQVDARISMTHERAVPLDPHDREAIARQVRAARLDGTAFEALYRTFVDPVYRFCCRRLDSPDAAADATSQIFVNAYAGLAGCDETRFRSWLFAIAHNVLVDHYRARHDHVSLDDAGDLPSRFDSPEEQAVRNEERLAIHRLLAVLTPDQRHIVELRLAGLTGGEIAEALGRSRGSVDTAQCRALARLRKALLEQRESERRAEVSHGPA